MRPRCGDAAIDKRLHHIWIGPLGPSVLESLPRWQIGDMTQRIVAAGNGAVDRASEQLAAEICHYMPSRDVPYVNCSPIDRFSTVAAAQNVID
jgi:hypothetical protein